MEVFTIPCKESSPANESRLSRHRLRCSSMSNMKRTGRREAYRLSEYFSLCWVQPILKPQFFFKFMRWDFGYCGHYWPIVPAPDDRWGWLWRNWWNEDWQGKPKYSVKTFPSATLSTTNPKWLNPVLNLGRRGGKPATNRLSYGAAITTIM
jgi:hypothetical protein